MGRCVVEGVHISNGSTCHMHVTCNSAWGNVAVNSDLFDRLKLDALKPGVQERFVTHCAIASVTQHILQMGMVVIKLPHQRCTVSIKITCLIM